MTGKPHLSMLRSFQYLIFWQGKMISVQLLTRSCLLALALISGSASAIDAAQVPASKQTKVGLYLDAREAHAFKQQAGSNALLIDIRTRSEVAYLGMPATADAHIPFVDHPSGMPWDDKSARFRTDSNPDFEPELARRLAAQGLSKQDTVILICRSGDRSARAVNLLTDLGYRKVYSVIDGYEGDVATDGPHAGQRVVNGWKNAGLPWTYKLEKSKMYLPSN